METKTKFFVISIQTTEETTSQSIFAYDTKEEALSAYHSTLASDYIATALIAFCAMVVNEHGGTEVREYWEKPEPTPED